MSCRRIIHFDVKSNNVLLGADGRVAKIAGVHACGPLPGLQLVVCCSVRHDRAGWSTLYFLLLPCPCRRGPGGSGQPPIRVHCRPEGRLCLVRREWVEGRHQQGASWGRPFHGRAFLIRKARCIIMQEPRFRPAYSCGICQLAAECTTHQ